MKNNYTLILLKSGRNILVSDEEIKAKDKYYSNFHKSILECVNDNHAKGLNLLNENKFNTLTEIDFNYKIIAGIDTLPVLTYSDKVKQILKDKHDWVDKNEIIGEIGLLGLEITAMVINYLNNVPLITEISQSFITLAEKCETHQFISNKMFSEKDIEYALKQLHKVSKGERSGGMTFKDFLKESLEEPIKLNVEVEMDTKCDYDYTSRCTLGRCNCKTELKITNNSILITKII